MTREFLVKCPTCCTTFTAEVPDDWTKQTLAAYTKDIFRTGLPQNYCGLHPRSLGTLELPLNEAWLRGTLEDPGDPGDRPDPKLPVYRPRNRPREGRRGAGREQAGLLTPALLRTLAAWRPNVQPQELAKRLALTSDTLTTNFARIREILEAPSNKEAQKIAREKGLL